MNCQKDGTHLLFYKSVNNSHLNAKHGIKHLFVSQCIQNFLFTLHRENKIVYYSTSQ